MSVTENQVMEALSQVMDPELNHNIVELGFVQELEIADDFVHLEIQLTTPMCPRADEIVDSIRTAVRAIKGVREVEVERTCMKNA